MTANEKKIFEAFRRMKILNLNTKAIDEFVNNKKLYLSFGGILATLTDSQKERVHNFETETGCLVYHVIYNNTRFGELLTFLYVSEYSEEWEMERTELAKGQPLAYVINLDNEFCSEFGTVGIKQYNGGLIRTE